MIRAAGLAAALCVGVVLPALAEEPEQLECTAGAAGMAHRLRLRVAAGEVTAFEYSSVDVTTASACGVAASKTPDGGLADSTWTALPDGATQVGIQTFATGTESIRGRVMIRNVAGGYELTAVPNPPWEFCARGAYLAPVATLTAGDARCRLGGVAAGPLDADTMQTVTLSGRLRQQREWGPPNFGENPKTDSTYMAWILELDRPVLIHEHHDDGTPRDDVTLKRIQLHELASAGSWKAMVGKAVLASGKMWTASTGGDVTAVTLHTEALRLKDGGR